MDNTRPITSFFSLDPRCGFHYFPDTFHYREADLKTWLPELQSFGASWLVLKSNLGRAIPEHFLRGIRQAGIQPVIQFQLPLTGMPLLRETSTLLEVYSHWGARYVVLFDRPNLRSVWPASGWAQQDLVERFLDRFLPLASLTLSAGMIPVFPPLEPGGSYWDTAFLRSALQTLLRRKQDQLLQSLVLSAYAWTGAHSLDWGAGGPESWPQARPYQTVQAGQDQRGFRIFEWYQSIAESVLLQQTPIMLFQAGLPGHSDTITEDILTSERYSNDCKSIVRLVGGEETPDGLAADKNLAPLTSQVIACNFWHLGAAPFSPSRVSPSGDSFEIQTPELYRWFQERQRERLANPETRQEDSSESGHSIRHYLLLPGTEWGVSDWYLEIIRPFVKKHLPTVGFSAEEAERADQVTVIGNLQNYPEGMLIRLKKAGCRIDQINGDGTKIASELAER